MNERIREIADQILPNEKEFHQGNPKEWGYFFSGDELEKFAELIVRECIGLLPEDCPSKNGCHTSWIIKEHFGVEA